MATEAGVYVCGRVGIATFGQQLWSKHLQELRLNYHKSNPPSHVKHTSVMAFPWQINIAKTIL